MFDPISLQLVARLGSETDNYGQFNSALPVSPTLLRGNRNVPADPIGIHFTACLAETDLYCLKSHS